MSQSLIKRFNDIKIRHKLILSFMVVVFVPVLLVGSQLTAELRSMALENALGHASSDMERIKTRVLEVIVPAVNAANYSLVDQRLNELVNTEYESVLEVVEAYDSYNTFENTVQLHNEITGIRFYADNDTMLNNWQFIPVDDQLENADWFQQTLAANGHLIWHYTENETSRGQKRLTLSRLLNYVNHQSYGVITIDINSNYINWILSQEMNPTMLLDEQDTVVASNIHETLGNDLKEHAFSSHFVNGETGIYEDVVFEEPSYIIVDELDLEHGFNSLRIVTAISESAIMENSDRLSRLGFAVILVSVIISLILIYSFSYLLSKRIDLLSRHIKKVGKGILSTEKQVEGKDEIGQLSEQFSIMTYDLKQLLKEIEKNNEERRELENRQNEIKLKMLASQINPHFLFNTLETVRMEANMKGEKEISQVVKKLGKLLRNSLEVSGHLIPLRQEADMVKAYLEIQKFRFKNRLDFDVFIDEEAEVVDIPPMIIQPVVENAVIHGIQHKKEGGKVTVAAHLLTDRLLIEVVDNGIGMTEERKSQVIQSLKAEKDENRIGLRNVHERIKLYYEKEEGISIESEHSKGTRISFSIPLKGTESRE